MTNEHDSDHPLGSTSARQRQQGVSTAWRHIRALEDQRQVLAFVRKGDPLKLADRCRDLLDDEGWLLDFHALVLRAMARVAYELMLDAEGAAKHDEPDEWLERCLDRSVLDLIEEDESAVHTGRIVSRRDNRIADLASLGMRPESVLLACQRVNEQPRHVRHAFMHLLVKRLTLDDYASKFGGTREQAKERVTQALLAINEIHLDEGGSQ